MRRASEARIHGRVIVELERAGRARKPRCSCITILSLQLGGLGATGCFASVGAFRDRPTDDVLHARILADAPIATASMPVYATTLTKHLACRHLTALDRLDAAGLEKRPYFPDPLLKVLRERGIAHEREYVEHLAASSKTVVEIDTKAPDRAARTLAAMRDGADVIVQARLELGDWAGVADVLLRVPDTTRYEPVETKLALEMRGATILQLCVYAELLTHIQGAAPELLRVVVPGRDFVAEEYRFAEYRSYFLFAKKRLEAELARGAPASLSDAEPYPEQVAHCKVCDWAPTCKKRWAGDDYVGLVANIQRGQRKELAEQNVKTLAGLAGLPEDLGFEPTRGTKAALVRTREQAVVQLRSRTEGKLAYTLLPIEADRGLAALPVPSASDVFLDLEGERLSERGGCEYLFGWAFVDDAGKEQYTAVWAMEPAQEKAAFERFIDHVMKLRERDPSMHVYHYAPYEPTAMKRLMGRYATRADELDVLLRSGTFVDLYAVVRRGVRAGVESYSIKKLEPFYGYVREVDLRLASQHRLAIDVALARGKKLSIAREVSDVVEGYNRDDCLSALRLRGWLEELRGMLEGDVPRPAVRDGEASEEVSKRDETTRRVVQDLVAELPVDRAERDAAQQAKWILAQLLEWHRREEKVEWWEFFRLNGMDAEDLREEPAGLSGLEFLERRPLPRGSVVDRYRFEDQKSDLDIENEVRVPGEEESTKFAEVVAIDFDARTVDLKKGKKRASQHPTAIFKFKKFTNTISPGALLRLGEHVRAHQMSSRAKHGAERDLLLRRGPRLYDGVPLRKDGETPLDSARRVVDELEKGVLAIQGPPGTGKTFAGARMIVELVRAGRRVGVTAVSHKVIRKLLEEVVRAAREENVRVKCMDRVDEESEPAPVGIHEELESKQAITDIKNGTYDVVGGTQWVWGEESLSEAIDVLFVDEAGQMSLANVLACAQAARSVVLLGDPQQLEQPQRAAHPDGAELSALEHLLGEHETMPEDRGLFLGETRRLHPDICKFTSDMFYEGKLQPMKGLERQRVSGPTRFAGAGLFFVPVEHEANRNASPEEAKRVEALVNELTQPDVTWTNDAGVTAALTLDDILIVAPFNAQVAELQRRLPGARVGTVDKFQGQEAPVVIYSMASSTSDDAPRGLDFLFNRHRLNVATSRARCICILVANPKLFELDCHTPNQMRMASAYCAYIEQATVVDPTSATASTR